MAKTKKPKLLGCASCPLQEFKAEKFVEVTGVEFPQLIVMYSAPGNWNLVQRIIAQSDLAITALVPLPAIQCKTDPDNVVPKVINACREAYVDPILAKYPGIPILALGETVGHTLFHKKRAMGSIGGKVRMIQGHPVYFTHEDLSTKEHQEHFRIMLRSLLAEYDKMPVEWELVKEVPESFWDSKYIVLDIETENFENFFLKRNEITIIGVANEHNDKVYCVLPGSGFYSKLSGYKGIVVAHGGNFDFVRLNHHGVVFSQIADTLIAEKNMPWAQVGQNALKWIGKRDYWIHGYEAQVHSCWDSGEIMSMDDLCLYNAYDVRLTKALYLDQQKEMYG